MSRTFTVTEKGNLDRIALMLATLRALHRLGGSGSLHVIYETVLVLEEVPPEEAYILGSNGKLKLRYGLDWSRTMLKHVGLVTNPRHGIWELTYAGRTEYTYADLKTIWEIHKKGGDISKAYPLQNEEAPSNTAPIAEIILEEENSTEPEGLLTSIQMQAKIAQIGATMHFDIWVPPSDRSQVKGYVAVDLHGRFVEGELPLGYNKETLSTVRQIDVLWLQGNAIARAFEIEHTTAVYSGLLRMADLLALQPNINIKLHIVAPDEREKKVLYEIGRPAFSSLNLPASCSFLSYTKICEFAEQSNLEFMSHAAISKYEVKANG